MCRGNSGRSVNPAPYTCTVLYSSRDACLCLQWPVILTAPAGSRKDGTYMEDCLHNCFPGMPDYYNWLVAHALIQVCLSWTALQAKMTPES